MRTEKPPKKILVIRLSSIGDIVLTTPVIRCLKQKYPDTEIHYLTKKQYVPLLAENPYIGKIHSFDHNFRELLPVLKNERFDYIADLHKNWRSAYFRIRLMRPSGSFPKLNIRKWMLVNLRIDRLPRIHIVDRYFRAVETIGIFNDGKGLDCFIPREDETDPVKLFPAAANGFIAMAIGARHNTKIFPAERAAEVCRGAGKPVFLLGGKEDRERGDLIVRLSGLSVFNTCGMLTLNQSASLIRQADALITNDTGMMHIGAAFRKKIISIWGNTIPEFGMYPYFPEGVENPGRNLEVKGLDCRPCSKLGFKECPKGHFKCMLQIRISDILNAL